MMKRLAPTTCWHMAELQSYFECKIRLLLLLVCGFPDNSNRTMMLTLKTSPQFPTTFAMQE